MATSNSVNLQFGIELTASMTGSFVLIGTLPVPVSILIFDNQGTEPVAISIDGVNTWRTFPVGEALVLDLSTNKGNGPDRNIAQGTTFYGNGASGTFSISYLNPKNQ